MLLEAREAPDKVAEFLTADQAAYENLGKRLRELQPAVVATIARGSSDHAANYAAYLMPLCTGTIAASLPPSTVTILRAPLKLKNQFVLAISQSGSSPDIIGTVERARESGALTAAIVNEVDSKLARTVEILLPQRAGKEVSVAATKTVLCTLTAIARVVASWSQDMKLAQGLIELPNVLREAVKKGLAFDDQRLRGVSHVYVLSRGYGLSAALEIALKLKEVCGLHAEALSSAEVRHGPREIVDQDFLVIGLALPGSGAEDVVAAASELKVQGARVVLIAPAGTPGADAELPPMSDDRLSPIVCLQLLYPWLARCSKALGRNPDQMRQLKSKVVNTI
jgi:glucosamine--fructose-6-phosphate aminotransferase (isomerizing)